MNNGWICIHRKLRGKGYYKRSAYVHLWIHLLLSANHEKKEIMWNGKIITIQPGQFLTGRKTLSRETGIPETTIERLLTFFSEQAQIGQQKTNKYRLITILNWDSYQKMDNQRTTSGQQMDTNNNYNNDNKKDFVPKSSFKGKKMKKNSFNYNESKSSDSYEDEIDLDSGEQINPQPTKRYPNSKIVFSLFGRYPANWRLNKSQLVAAENLFAERGLEKITKALNFYKTHKEEKYCPTINSPYDLDSKWMKLIDFKNKNEN